jgi:hypothetical protein
VQIGIGVQLADQREPTAVTLAEAGNRVAAVTGIADKDEGALGKPQQHQTQQPAHQLGRRAMRTFPFLILLGAAVEIHQYG